MPTHQASHTVGSIGVPELGWEPHGVAAPLTHALLGAPCGHLGTFSPPKTTFWDVTRALLTQTQIRGGRGVHLDMLDQPAQEGGAKSVWVTLWRSPKAPSWPNLVFALEGWGGVVHARIRQHGPSLGPIRRALIEFELDQ